MVCICRWEWWVLKLALKGPTILKNDDINDDDTMLPERSRSWAT